MDDLVSMFCCCCVAECRGKKLRQMLQDTIVGGLWLGLTTVPHGMYLRYFMSRPVSVRREGEATHFRPPRS